LLADFGLSKVMDDQQFSALTTTCGTPGASPVRANSRVDFRGAADAPEWWLRCSL